MIRSEITRITDSDPDHLKGAHPKIHVDTLATFTLFQRLSVQKDTVCKTLNSEIVYHCVPCIGLIEPLHSQKRPRLKSNVKLYGYRC